MGTLELLRDSRNEASRYVSNHNLTAVLLAGALGPQDARCPWGSGDMWLGALLCKEGFVDFYGSGQEALPGTPRSVHHLEVLNTFTSTCPGGWSAEAFSP